LIYNCNICDIIKYIVLGHNITATRQEWCRLDIIRETDNEFYVVNLEGAVLQVRHTRQTDNEFMYCTSTHTKKVITMSKYEGVSKSFRTELIMK
jgi:hypothetical protein